MRMMITAAATAAVLLSGAAPVLAAPATAPAAAAQLNSCGYDVNGHHVHLRSGPGTRYASLGHLSRGDLIDVDRKTGGWYRVTVSERTRSGIKAGTTGWVSERYLKPSVCMQLD